MNSTVTGHVVSLTIQSSISIKSEDFKMFFIKIKWKIRYSLIKKKKVCLPVASNRLFMSACVAGTCARVRLERERERERDGAISLADTVWLSLLCMPSWIKNYPTPNSF